MSSITLSAVLAIVIIAISYLVMRVFSLEHRVHAVEQMRQLEEMNKVYGECGTEDALCTLPVHLMGFGDVILPEPEPPAPLKREETGINIEEDAIREEPTAEDMISEEPAAGPSTPVPDSSHEDEEEEAPPHDTVVVVEPPSAPKKRTKSTRIKQP